MTHDTVLAAFEQLSAPEKRLALSAIEASWESRTGLIAELGQQQQQSRVGNMACPHCQSHATIRRGMIRDSQVEKFTCKSCNKHFSSSYGTALFRIQRKDKWQAYLKLMEQGISIKKAAKELGISIQTSFDWRHKILSSLQTTLPGQLGGIVECDDFQLTESHKGQRKLDRKPRKRGSDGHKHGADKVSVVTAVSRSKGSITSVVKAKKISGKEALTALKGKLEKGTVFITDEAGSYNAIARNDKDITHKKVNSKKNRSEKPVGKIHLQTVNNQHKQIRDFLTPFNGVSTKYLPNYLNWFIYKQSQKDNREKIVAMLSTCLAATAALTWLAKLIQ